MQFPFMKSFALFMLLASFTSLGAGAEDCKWVSLGGPASGAIRSLAIDPNSPQTIYACLAKSGVFKSTNGGNSWSHITSGLPPSKSNTLAIDPKSSQIIYVGTDAGVFKSKNGGSDWSATGLSGIAIGLLLIDPVLPQILYAGFLGTGAGPFKSMDGGDNWSTIGSGLPFGMINALAIDPTSPQTLYAAAQGGLEKGAVYKSTNGGNSWIVTGLTGIYIWTLAVDPSSPQLLYAGSSAGVLKSANGGDSWSAANPSLTSIAILALVVDPSTPRILYAGSSQGVFKSTDAGNTWSAAKGMPNYYVGTLAIAPTSPQTLYACVSRQGLLKSTDGGNNWSDVSPSLTKIKVITLVIDPQTPQTLYAGTENSGVYKSTNGGDTWMISSNGLDEFVVLSLAIDPVTPQTLYAGTYYSYIGGVFKSTNGGGSWSAVNTGMGSWGLVKYAINALAIDPKSPQIVYAAKEAGHVYKSANGGDSWSWNYVGTSDAVWTLAIDPKSPQTIYAGTGGGMFKSTDGGVHWSAINSGLTNSTIYALAIDPTTPQILYAGTNGGGVFKSTNGGDSWSSANSGLTSASIYTLVADPTRPHILYAGTNGGGIFKSIDAGGSWSAINSGLASAQVTVLAIGGESPPTLYASTRDAGVWRYTCPCSAPTKPTLISPSGETTATPTYFWNAVSAADQYLLWVNDSATSGKIQLWFSSADAGCPFGTGMCSVTPSTALSKGAGTWRVQAKSNCGGSSSYSPWSGEMAFLVADPKIPGKATLVAPSGVIQTATPTYTWNAVADATRYQLWVNDAADSPKIQSWYTATQAGCASGTGTCTARSTIALAAGDCQWWVQTWNEIGFGPWSGGKGFKVDNGVFELAEITSPAPSSTLTSTVVPFVWTPGRGVSQYWLFVGKAAGGMELYNEGQKTNLSALVGKLPNDGSPIYVRLWSLVGGVWKFNDYTFISCNGCGSILAAITYPVPGTTLRSESITFNWSAGTGVSQYWLSIGRSWGSSDLYDRDQGLTLSATVRNLPNDGRTIYVRLWSKIIGYWAFNDYTYTAGPGSGPPGKAMLVSPVGSISAGTPTYMWKAVSGSTWYYLWVTDSTTDPKIQQWYKAADVGCGSGTGTCSVTPETMVAKGTYLWWIQTYNDFGYGPWSDAMSFTVVGAISGPYGIEFVEVPAGEFKMGSTRDHEGEQPIHRVIISKSFQLGKYEITQGQWKM